MGFSAAVQGADQPDGHAANLAVTFEMRYMVSCKMTPAHNQPAQVKGADSACKAVLSRFCTFDSSQMRMSHI